MENIKEMIPEFFFTVLAKKIYFSAFWLSFIIFLNSLAKKYISNKVANIDFRYRAKKISNIVAFLIFMLIVMSIFSDKMKNFGVALGVTGAGLAFALQSVILSFVGWIVIILGHFYSVGDRIEFDGIKGDVIDVGILVTTIMEIRNWIDADSYTGRIIRVSNNTVFKSPVFNYSADFPFIWDQITIPVKYGSDWEYAKETFLKAANDAIGDYAQKSKDSWDSIVKKYRVEKMNIMPVVNLKITDNWIDFTIMYIVDYKKRAFTKNLLHQTILKEVDKSQGKILLASTTVEILSFPEVRVKGEINKP